ncbi:MAG: NAD(P)/FAD-dependent oxidoreductase [Alphaproteobacteria bacterium]|nr:NAD(P)/FAD-dependent oxidoreductase [Alphaproteobacteria bacterium]
MAKAYDAIIVGGGHNGLVCGTYLAKAGLKALVLERRSLIGGACVTEEPWPGFKVSTGSYLMSLLQPKIILDLELKKHGLEVLPTTPTFAPWPDGRSIVFWPDEAKLCAEFAKFSAKDAETYPRYRRMLERLTPFIREIIWETPPNIASTRPRDLLRTAGFAFKYRKHAGLFYELYDIFTMSAYDYLTKWFESDAVIAALGYYVHGGGTNASMKMPATAFSCIRPLVRDNTTAAGTGGFVRGGMGSISNAIARCGAAHGLEVRTDAPVARINTVNGIAKGVTLADGEVLEAKCVIANANAKTTFLKLLPEAELPSDFVQNVRNIRTRSSVFKVHLAADKLPEYTAFSSAERGFAYPVSVRIGHSIDYLERAYDDAKYGGFSRQPFLTVMAPSVFDDTLTPKGMHLLSIMGGHASYELKGRGWSQAREELLQTTVDTIEAYAPGFRRHIVHSEILTPVDLEERFDLPNGHVHHGDLTIDQQFFRRPVGGYADYRTPVAQLYLCGSSAHPGGGVTGVPGHNAAREVLKDLGR